MTNDPKFKYKLKRLSDYHVIPATKYLIRPYIPLGAHIVVAGLPKTGKSYLGISWAGGVALGLPWLGHPTGKGRVLYVALESYDGVLRRKEAWRIFHGKSKADLDNFTCATEPINFAQEGQIEQALPT